MMKTSRSTLLLALLAVALLLPACSAQRQKKLPEQTYGIGFYNLENLFDTIHDEGKNDYEFLPDGGYGWTSEKYEAKLRNLARVLSEMCSDATAGHAAVIGVAEVENSRALDDLTAQPALQALGMKYAHIEGVDKRGIDCAVLYDPTLFHLQDSRLVPYHDAANPDFKTRGFLVVSGTLAGDLLHVVVCHWPSRASAEETRVLAGQQTRAVKDSLLRAFPGSKVVVMGDLNDDPSDRSLEEGLGCKYERQGVAATEMYNPWRAIHVRGTVETGTGTLTYQGKWNLFDQIVVSGTLLSAKSRHLHYDRNEIFRRDYLLQQDGKYKGTPLRTHAGGQWLNGYSDHLPTMIYLKK